MGVLREGEQRDCFRSNDGRNALIRCGRGREFLLELVEVAAWGFTVLADEPLPLKADKIYRLRTSAGWSEVQVVHSQQDGGKHRYGLTRIQDLPDHRADQRLLAVGGERLRHDLPKERIANVGYFVVLGFALAVYLYYAYN